MDLVTEKTRKVAAALEQALKVVDGKGSTGAARWLDSPHVNDRQLRADLQACLESESSLNAEIERLTRLADSLTGDDRRSVEYQIDLAQWQIERASQEAARRLELLQSLDTQAKRNAELERCKNDTIY